MSLTLLIGGARSGKSAIAQRWAVASGVPVTYVATGQKSDDEMIGRIDRHQADRPADFVTIEAPVDLAAALGSVPADSFIIVDCLTIWISNLLEWRNEAEILEASREVIERTTARTAPVVVVSNEVGMGLVPMHLVGRAFRDIAGRVNQQWVAAADRSFLVMAGQVSELSPVPDVL